MSYFDRWLFHWVFSHVDLILVISEDHQINELFNSNTYLTFLTENDLFTFFILFKGDHSSPRLVCEK